MSEEGKAGLVLVIRGTLIVDIHNSIHNAMQMMKQRGFPTDTEPWRLLSEAKTKLEIILSEKKTK